METSTADRVLELMKNAQSLAEALKTGKGFGLAPDQEALFAAKAKEMGYDKIVKEMEDSMDSLNKKYNDLTKPDTGNVPKV